MILSAPIVQDEYLFLFHIYEYDELATVTF